MSGMPLLHVGICAPCRGFSATVAEWRQSARGGVRCITGSNHPFNCFLTIYGKHAAMQAAGHAGQYGVKRVLTCVRLYMHMEDHVNIESCLKQSPHTLHLVLVHTSVCSTRDPVLTPRSGDPISPQDATQRQIQRACCSITASASGFNELQCTECERCFAVCWHGAARHPQMRTSFLACVQSAHRCGLQLRVCSASHSPHGGHAAFFVASRLQPQCKPPALILAAVDAHPCSAGACMKPLRAMASMLFEVSAMRP